MLEWAGVLNESKEKTPHTGSSFEDFLKEIGDYEEVQARAVRRLIALELRQTMKTEDLSKTAMARPLDTSGARLDLLLDPKDPTDLKTSTLLKAASVIGKTLHVELRDT